jgi:hypothetical protein
MPNGTVSSAGRKYRPWFRHIDVTGSHVARVVRTHLACAFSRGLLTAVAAAGHVCHADDPAYRLKWLASAGNPTRGIGMQTELDYPGIVRSFLAPAAVAGVVSGLFQLIAKAKLDSHFTKQLEAFKAQLSGLADAARFDYSRRLADFSLFAAKRHEVYVEVYRRYRATFDAYQQYRVAYHRNRGHKTLNEAEVRALMTRNRVKADAQKDVVAQWDANRDEGVRLLNVALDRRYGLRARAVFDRAQDFWLANYVYASKDVRAKVSSLVPSLKEYVDHLEQTSLEERARDEVTKSKWKALEEEVRDKLEALTDALRDELRRGDYEGSVTTWPGKAVG